MVHFIIFPLLIIIGERAAPAAELRFAVQVFNFALVDFASLSGFKTCEAGTLILDGRIGGLKIGILGNQVVERVGPSAVTRWRKLLDSVQGDKTRRNDKIVTGEDKVNQYNYKLGSIDETISPPTPSGGKFAPSPSIAVIHDFLRTFDDYTYKRVWPEGDAEIHKNSSVS